MGWAPQWVASLLKVMRDEPRPTCRAPVLPRVSRRLGVAGRRASTGVSWVTLKLPGCGALHTEFVQSRPGAPETGRGWACGGLLLPGALAAVFVSPAFL